MKRLNLMLTLAAAASILLAGCYPPVSEPPAAAPTEAPRAVAPTPEVVTLFVADTPADCDSSATGKCLQVGSGPDGPWTPLSDPIDGFVYEAGFVYELQVSKEAVADPAAGASGFRWTLIKVVSKTQTVVEEQPTDAATPAVAEATATAAGDLAGASWQWMQTASADGVLQVDDPTRYTVEFLPDGTLGVQADCNRGSGTYQVDGSSLTIGPIATTKMACAAGSLDSRFLAELGNASTYLIEGDTLIISLALDAGDMQFARAGEREAEAAGTPTPTDMPEPTSEASPAPPETGGELAGRWILESLRRRGELAPVLADGAITAEVAADAAAIAGSTGCNAFAATLSVAGESLTVGQVSVAQQTCAAEIMAQETAFVAALLGVRGYLIEEDRLTLVSRGGQPMLVFVRE